MNNTTKIGLIQKALDALATHEERCQLCPRECGVNRKKGEKGFCRAGLKASLSHALLHLGEEPVLSGYADCRINDRPGLSSGSGTIFFSGCHLKCLFCQNHQLSWQGKGHSVSEAELASTMLNLQEQGALNINLVSPSHQILPILKALKIAFASGLRLPLVYNSNGYEKGEIIKELEGIIDIYLPDFKYSSGATAKKYSGVSDYSLLARRAIQEMIRQKPVLVTDEQEIAQEGVIIRHLVLPGNTEDSQDVLEWIKENLDNDIGFSLMSQYQPCFMAPSELQRTLTPEEYESVLSKAKELKSALIFFQPQPINPEESLVPDFDKDIPFDWGD
jgi:putative pyruvate formate lyase activating enzyme